MLKRRDVIALGLAALSAPAFGQAHYPDRPIRLVVPFPPGGAFDTVARPWANMMKSQGAGPAITDLVAGQVPMIVPAMNGSVLELRDRRIRLAPPLPGFADAQPGLRATRP
jgi:hypothetical protein